MKRRIIGALCSALECSPYLKSSVMGVSIFLLFATVRIFLVVRRIARQNAAVVAQLNFNHKLQHGVAFKARETASAKMLGIVVTVFVVSFLPWVADSICILAELRYPNFLTEIYDIYDIMRCIKDRKPIRAVRL